jgi:hypothetical protein
MSSRDENDRLLAGQLPVDPRRGHGADALGRWVGRAHPI